jgi:Alpha-L-rhamnosidase N-terminal domain./Bacterial alpha-L-rhamnosidase.
MDKTEKYIDWKAKWIWKGSRICVNDFACLRKVFNISNCIVNGKAYISAHNHFILYINGSKVSGYVTPVPSHPQKSKYYLTYDVTELLQNGGNSICALVHYLGGGGQNYVDGMPGFIFQCHVKYRDGSEDIIISDETWKALGETPYRNGTEFQQNRRISAIEDYDARKEESDWLLYNYDDSHWNMASLSHINGCKYMLKPQEIPEGGIYEIIVPKAVGIQKCGLQVLDAGKIISGWPRFKLNGINGVKIRMRYSEDTDESGSVRHNVCNETSENYYDQYTMRGDSQESWEPCFSYKAFRYIEVTGYPSIIKPEEIEIISAGTGLTYRGNFNSSNQLLNGIYAACIQTQKNNVLGQMVDCPHREQAQYLADSDLQAETFIYNFINSTVLEKVLLDFKDIQNQDGSLPFVFPTNTDNEEFNIKIPEWDLHYITLLWKIYYMYDNTEILHQCYDTAKRIVQNYLQLIDKVIGLIPKAEGFPYGWNISDWPYPDIDESGPYLTVQNCLFYHVLGLMQEIASILGYNKERDNFRVHADRLYDAINKNLYLPDLKRFADCYNSNQSHQGTNVAAFQYGLVTEEDRSSVLDYIVGCGFVCSTLLSLNLLQLLFENGKEQEAYQLLDRVEQPGWGYMIAKRYKTIWEGFQDIESHSHAWNAYPARILAEYIVGIKATAPGFKKIDIKPYIPAGMQFAEGTVPTVKGDIYAKWIRDGESLTVKVRIPNGITACVYLPGSYKSPVSIYEQGEYVLHG